MPQITWKEMLQMALVDFSPHKDPNVKTYYWNRMVHMLSSDLWLNSKTGVLTGFEMRLPWLENILVDIRDRLWQNVS